MNEALAKFLALASEGADQPVNVLRVKHAALGLVAECEDANEISDELWLSVPGELRPGILALFAAAALARV